MNRKVAVAIVSQAITLAILLSAAWQAKAQNTQTPQPSMAPLDQYLMVDRNTEIPLVRSAPRRPYLRMLRSLSWDDMVLKKPSKVRMASFALSNDHGCSH
jgi:hypothetical protein